VARFYSKLPVACFLLHPCSSASSAVCLRVIYEFQSIQRPFVMAALWNRAGYYIFALWFLLFFFFSSPNLSRRRLDVYHTSTHGVALVRI